MSDILLPRETAAFVRATADLIAACKAALVRADPAMETLFLGGRAVRIAYGEDERAVCVSLVDDHGQGHPLLGIVADPQAPDCGRIGLPYIVRGLYAQHEIAH